MKDIDSKFTDTMNIYDLQNNFVQIMVYIGYVTDIHKIAWGEIYVQNYKWKKVSSLFGGVLSAVNGSEFIALFLSGITETCTFFLIFMLKIFLKKFRTFMGLVQARGPYV